MIDYKNISIYNKTYDNVISLGQDCACAGYLVRFGLRDWSGPFDWIGVLYAGIVKTVDIIVDNFKDFIHPEALEYFVPAAEIPLELHFSFVRDKITNVHFAHDFPKQFSIQESYAKVKSKYDRRIERFVKVMESPKSKLLVCWARVEHPSEADIKNSALRLRQHFHNSKIDLLYIENVDNMTEIELREIDDGVVYARGWFYNKAINRTMGNIKLNSRIFKRIKAKNRLKNLLRLKISAWSRKLKTFFIISKQKRRLARAQMRERCWEY